MQSFSAQSLVPEKWLKSDDYSVDVDVINKDFMNHYRVQSRFGLFLARGNDRLFVRIREISALARLEEMSKSKLFATSAGETVALAVDKVNNAIDDPSGAADDLGSGLSRLGKRLSRMGKNAFDKGRSLIYDQRTEQERSDELARTGQNVAKGVLGVNRAYRELSRDLGVDPYTRNGLLRYEIERMANYSAAGSMGIKTVLPVLPLLYGAGYLVSVSNLVWNTHPIDLQLQNEKALAEMGTSDSLASRLFESEYHTLTTQTRVVKSLQSLAGVKGRSVLMRAVSRVGTVNDALFYTRMIELLGLYHQKRGNLAEIIATNRIPYALTTNRRAVVIVPIDYLRWTRLADGFTRYLRQQISSRGSHMELWVSGRVSSRARKELGDRGWVVFDRAGRRI